MGYDKPIDKQMKYELNRLNPNDFQDLIQSLLKKIIGHGTITFGPGLPRLTVSPANGF
jgi:hypothetical protein